MPKLGCLNVCGWRNQLEKRCAIDDIIHGRGLDVMALSETKLKGLAEERFGTFKGVKSGVSERRCAREDTAVVLKDELWVPLHLKGGVGGGNHSIFSSSSSFFLLLSSVTFHLHSICYFFHFWDIINLKCTQICFLFFLNCLSNLIYAPCTSFLFLIFITSCQLLVEQHLQYETLNEWVSELISSAVII